MLNPFARQDMVSEQNNEWILRRVGEAIRHVFRCPGADITAATVSADIDGWDSLSHVMLILECEKMFGIRFPKEHIYSMKDVGEMCQIILGVLARHAPLDKA